MEPRTASRLSSLAPDQQLVLDYLSSRDERWLAWLLAECGRMAGRRLGELRERFAAPLGVAAPKHKLRAAVQVLERLLPEQPAREPAPREVRERLFRAAAASAAGRQRIVQQVAQELGVAAWLLEQALFADLADERRVGAVPSDLTPSRLSLLVNQALVHGFLKRALSVTIQTWGDGHALLRQARRLGLICVPSGKAGPAPSRVATTSLEISGPFVLFRKTELYGRALASLLPHAARAPHFELRAECAVAGRSTRCTLRITPADPIFAAREPTAFDSRAETRFFRDFARLASPFQLVREPAPVQLDGEPFFPDFELVHEQAPARRYRVELIGFWTPEYLKDRLSKLRDDDEQRFILCVDEARGCGNAALPQDARLFHYKSRLSAEKLLAFIAADGSGP